MGEAVAVVRTQRPAPQTKHLLLAHQLNVNAELAQMLTRPERMGVLHDGRHKAQVRHAEIRRTLPHRSLVEAVGSSPSAATRRDESMIDPVTSQERQVRPSMSPKSWQDRQAEQRVITAAKVKKHAAELARQAAAKAAKKKAK